MVSLSIPLDCNTGQGRLRISPTRTNLQPFSTLPTAIVTPQTFLNVSPHSNKIQYEYFLFIYTSVLPKKKKIKSQVDKQLGNDMQGKPLKPMMN